MTMTILLHYGLVTLMSLVFETVSSPVVTLKFKLKQRFMRLNIRRLIVAVVSVFVFFSSVLGP